MYQKSNFPKDGSTSCLFIIGRFNNIGNTENSWTIRLDEFYFRWLENSIIEIGKTAHIPLFHFQSSKLKTLLANIKIDHVSGPSGESDVGEIVMLVT